MQQRKQITGSALEGFPIWEIILFLFESFCQGRSIVERDISLAIGRTVPMTLRYLRLMEAEGMVFIQYNEARLEIFIKLSSKTHAAITNYLGSGLID